MMEVASMPESRSPSPDRLPESGMVTYGISGSDDEAPLSSHRQMVERDTNALIREAGVLQEVIEQGTAALRYCLGLLASGTSIADILERTDAGTRREALTAQLHVFEAKRHELRLSLSAAGRQEEMTIGQLGRALKMSRQLASRYAREAEDRNG